MCVFVLNLTAFFKQPINQSLIPYSFIEDTTKLEPIKKPCYTSFEFV